MPEVWPRDESKTLAAAGVVPGNTLTAVISVPWLVVETVAPLKDKQRKHYVGCEPKTILTIMNHEPLFYHAETTTFIPSLFHLDESRHQRPKTKKALLKQRQQWVMAS